MFQALSSDELHTLDGTLTRALIRISEVYCPAGQWDHGPAHGLWSELVTLAFDLERTYV